MFSINFYPLLPSKMLSILILASLPTLFQISSSIFPQSTIAQCLSELKDCRLIFAYDGKIKTEIQQLIFSLSSQSPSVTYLVDILSNQSTELTTDVNRFSSGPHCSLVVLTLWSESPNIYQQLSSSLTPHWLPLSKKDEDHYFFLCSSPQLCENLLLSPFGSKIKNKIAFVKKSQETILQSVHPYKKNGAAQLIQLDFEEKYERILPQLFPDMTSSHFGRPIRMSCPMVKFRIEIEWSASQGKYQLKRGYYKYWLDEAMKKFNFTPDVFYSSSGGSTGVRLANGTWSGGRCLPWRRRNGFCHWKNLLQTQICWVVSPVVIWMDEFHLSEAGHLLLSESYCLALFHAVVDSFLGCCGICYFCYLSFSSDYKQVRQRTKFGQCIKLRDTSTDLC